MLIAFLGIQCGTFAGGVAAGLLAALYGPLVFYEAEVLNDTVFLFLLTAFLVLFLRSLEATSIRPALYVGLLGGLAAITRPNALLICGPMIVAGVIVLFRRRLNSFPIVWLLAACLPFSILVGMPTLYNVRKGDPALICTQGGINFWIGNNPSANGTNVTLPKLTEQGNEYRDTVEEYAKLGYFVDQYGTQQGLLRFYAGDPAPRPSELSAYWYRKALRYLLEHPWEAARLYARKLIALFNNHEVRNNRDFGFARANESLVLRLLPVNYALVLALAILGLTHAGVRRSPKLRWLLLYMGLAGVSVPACSSLQAASACRFCRLFSSSRGWVRNFLDRRLQTELGSTWQNLSRLCFLLGASRAMHGRKSISDGVTTNHSEQESAQPARPQRSGYFWRSPH